MSVSCFLGHINPMMLITGTQQIRQILQALLAVSIYAKKEEQVTELVKFLFRDMNVAVTLINGSRFLQFILKTNAKTSSSSFHNMKVPNKFEVFLFFHVFQSFKLRSRGKQ